MWLYLQTKGRSYVYIQREKSMAETACAHNTDGELDCSKSKPGRESYNLLQHV